jgi:hypothetical protein
MSAGRDVPKVEAAGDPHAIAEMAKDIWRSYDQAHTLLCDTIAASYAFESVAASMKDWEPDVAKAGSFVARSQCELLEKLDTLLQTMGRLAKQIEGAAEAKPAQLHDVPQALPDNQVKRCGTSDAPMPLWRDGKRKGRA